MKRRIGISKGGQISIPAPVRKRWQTSTLILEDAGDRLILEPTPDDPVAAAEGSLAEFFPGGIDLAEIRAQARADDEHALRRRHGADAS